MKKNAISIFFLFLIMTNTYAAEGANPALAKTDLISASLSPAIEYNISNAILEKSAIFDAKMSILVEGNEHLVLQYFSRGRKQRGQVLFLHAEGESPANNRLVQPLTTQLTNLGWTIYIPNIARENYPKLKKIKKNEQTDNQASDKTGNEANKETNENIETNSTNEKPINTNNLYFKDHAAYQDYYSQLCITVLEQIDAKQQPTIIIANQHSAYWSLDCLAKANAVFVVVFLKPSLPELPENDLAEKFTKQSLPLFSFGTSDQINGPFDKVFRKRTWHSNSHRFNVGMLVNSRLNLEDNFIARSITGWFEKQRNE